MYVCMYASIYNFVLSSKNTVYVRMHVCMYVHMYLCMYVGVCMYACMYVRTCFSKYSCLARYFRN